jgi:hypothetical protein
MVRIPRVAGVRHSGDRTNRQERGGGVLANELDNPVRAAGVLDVVDDEDTLALGRLDCSVGGLL